LKIKGQNRGHCQVCGRIQVVLPDGNIAKHGYTVPSGYFRGICQGSAYEPLQISRTLTDAIILAMNQRAQQDAAHAVGLGTGALKPETAQQLTAWGSRVYQTIDHKQVAVMLPWRDATGTERTAQLKLEISEAESHARFARGHAKSLTELAATVHGQPLIDRDAEELARVAERTAKTAPIAGAFRTKIAQKRELEALGRAYSELVKDIKDTYLEKRDVKGKAMYFALPFDLHQWRTKHSLQVLDIYPEHKPQVDAIEILVINRNEIKARPVIK
jgi:hypothetical protein